MDDIRVLCPACEDEFAHDDLRCAHCGSVVRWRLRIKGSPFRVRPIANGIAAAHGMGSDAISSSSEGVDFAGTLRAVNAMAEAAQAEGHAIEPLPPAIERPGAGRPRIVRAVALGLGLGVLVLLAVWLRIMTAPAPDVPRGAGLTTARGPADAGSTAASADAASVDAAPGPDSGPPRPDIDPQIVARAKASTVHIIAERRTATGVFVSSDGLILTHSAAVGQEESVLVRLPSGERVEGEVIAYRPGEQLAVVRIEPDEPPQAALMGEGVTLEPGTPLFALVGRDGRRVELRSGWLRRGPAWMDGAPTLALDLPLGAAASGAPLFDTRGQLVGLATDVPSDFDTPGHAQAIEFARHGDDAILAAPLYPLLPGERFAALLAARPPTPPPPDTRDPDLTRAAAELESPTGVLFIIDAIELRTGLYRQCAPGVGPRAYRYCRIDLGLTVLALTADARRPVTPDLTLRIATGRHVSQHGLPVRDAGWRSHKPTDREWQRAVKGFEKAVGVNPSVWSTTVEIGGQRLAELLSLSLQHPAVVVLEYGDGAYTDGFRLPGGTRAAAKRRRERDRNRRPRSRFSPDVEIQTRRDMDAIRRKQRGNGR